jgi:hypothetical protein
VSLADVVTEHFPARVKRLIENPDSWH